MSSIIASTSTTTSPVQGPPPQPQHPQLSSSPQRTLFTPTPIQTTRANAVDASPGSPLRHTTLTDYDNADTPTPGTTGSFRGVIDFANSRIGRATMSYTGDRKGARARRIEATEMVMDTAGESTTTPANPAAASSRFNIFTSTMFKHTPTSNTSPVSVPHDELMNLDIDSALYPSGDTSFSPAAYRNLQQNASGLLHKFQAAYQQNAIAFHELKAERSAQADEREETETKMCHLKLQLEGMARKAAEQEETMRSLVEELTHEKKLRVQERQNRGSAPSIAETSSTSVSEDLGAEEDQITRQWRRSMGATRSDVGCDDTDEESVDEASVFSRSRSPTIATSITDISPIEPPLPTIKTPTIVAPAKMTPTPRPAQDRQQQPQMNTFQKLFKGMSGEAAQKQMVKSCQNCEGQNASVAWDTVNLLKDENKGLKERVGDLEGAVEGALDVVNRVGL